MIQQRNPQLLKNQDGSVIVIVMLVLIAVSALSVAMMNFSASDVDMAGNYKFDKMAFYSGDSGIYATPKFIRLVYPEGEPIDEESPTQAGCVQFLNTTQPDSAMEIMQRIYGFEGRDATESLNDSVEDEMDSAANDISMRGCNVPADVNIIRLGGEQMSGGGVEFGSGAEGVGSAAQKSVNFRLVSTGNDDLGNSHTIRAIYRWVDVPGGL
jgi:hypothetical protein